MNDVKSKSIFGNSSININTIPAAASETDKSKRKRPDTATEEQASWDVEGPRHSLGAQAPQFRRPSLPPRSISLPKSLSDILEEQTRRSGWTDLSLSNHDHSTSRKRPLITPPTQSQAQPLHKRRKLYNHYAQHRHILEYFESPPNPASPNQPPSPLFFSHSTNRERPLLPPRFSSSEAGARMLSSTHGEDSGIKTVTLPRGSKTDAAKTGGVASPVPTSIPRLTPHTSFGSTSPEAFAKSHTSESNNGLHLLGELGITELLEQDGRPTFIIDLGEAGDFGSGPVRVVFANSALKANAAWMDLVAGKVIDPGSRTPAEPGGKPIYHQFKSWMLSSTERGESLDVCLPSFLYGGIAWSCSTIRKRFRVVSASAFLSDLPSRTASSSSTTSASAAKTHRKAFSDDLSITATIAETVEPPDYFGDAAPPEPPPHDVQAAKAALNMQGHHTIVPPDVHRPPEMGFNGRLLNQNSMNNLKLAQHLQASSLGNELVLSVVNSSGIDPFSYTSTSATNHSHNRPSSPPSSMETSVSPSVAALTTTTESMGFFDWTQLPVSDDMPSHIQFARSVDWASTALGPIEKWDADLRQMCNLIMASPHPAAMYWGEDLVAIYNEAYVLLAGQKHPKLMGQSYRNAWAEIWDEVKDVFASARKTGEATMKDDDCLFIKRSDYLEETYFSWSIIPMVGSDGAVAGLYNPAFEKTRRKIAERRMLTLREVGERTATARDVKGFWEQVSVALESNEFDTPLVLCYSVSDETESDSSSIHSSSMMASKQCYLEGALGVPTGHPAAPAQIDLKNGEDGLGPVFREVTKLGKPVLLDITSKDDGAEGPVENSAMLPSSDGGSKPHAGNGQLPASMLQGVEWRGFGDQCRSVVVCPVHPTNGDVILGFLVLGVNPRRPYDDDYHLFVQLLSRQLGTSLASVVLFEEEIKRGQRAAKLAALDRIELSEQLAARTQEARDIELRFTRMAEFSPAGLFIADSEGHITYCNDTWYEITRVPKNAHATDRWIDVVKEEDQSLVRQHWSGLIHDIKPINIEFRFKAPWSDRTGNKGDTWVLFSAYPEKYTEDVGVTVDVEGRQREGRKEGSLKSVFGSVTDISQQKWAEGWQKRKMEEAVELKRQQENFIDITSHEMRNPLSAILQCADDVFTSWTDHKAQTNGSNPQTLEQLIEATVDNAQTITLCAQHQKRIVDDVLTLSKLDSAMLMVTPVDVRPVEVAQRALKMFEGEVATANIDMQFIIDRSFHDLGVEWVRVDPSRVLQVLINLTTNAIKFTASEQGDKTGGRRITVTIGASEKDPSQLPPGKRKVDYVQPRSKRLDMTGEKDWGEGQEVYIDFSVTDTGRGLTAAEKKMLFLRFSQASPRTHVQYGGSGLGLFISRELTELQGGKIGVASEAGKGSTFAFYVKARRSTMPNDPDAALPPMLRSNNNDPAHRKPSTGATSAIRTKDFAGAVGGQGTAKKKREPGEIKVLIVEDNLVNQRVLRKQLQNVGFDITVANHGGEALEVLRSTTYWIEKDTQSPNGNTKDGGAKAKEIHVVLMDQEMPVMDGMQCTKRIRYYEQQGEIVRHIPIIGVTANARQGQIEQLREAGMDDVVSKPFRIPELVPKIEELAAKYPSDARSSTQASSFAVED